MAIFLSLGWWLAATPALAQEPQTRQRWEISGSFGWRVGSDPGANVIGPNPRGWTTRRYCFALQPSLGIPLGRQLLLKASYRYIRVREERDVPRNEVWPGNTDYYTGEYTGVGLELQYTFPFSARLEPYVSLGGGVGYTTSEYFSGCLGTTWPRDEKPPAEWVLPVLAGGTKIMLRQNLAVLVGLRYERALTHRDAVGIDGNTIYREAFFLETGLTIFL